MKEEKDEKVPVEDDLEGRIKEAVKDLCFAVHKFLNLTFGVGDHHRADGEKPYRVVIHSEDRTDIISDYVCLQFRPREVFKDKTGILYVSFYSETDYPAESVFGLGSEVTRILDQHGFAQISPGTLSTEVMREWFPLEQGEPRWAEQPKAEEG